MEPAQQQTLYDSIKDLRAYHGDAAIKEKYLSRVQQHRAADELIKGRYWEGGKGCAVGCTVHSGSHRAYEIELGIPRVLARLEDGIFEALPNDLAMTWPERFLEAVPIGANLSMVFYQFMHWLLADETEGVIRFATDRTRPSIEAVIALFNRQIAGDNPTRAEWRSADAAAYAADAAAYAADAAADAADAAAYAAYAADAAAYAADAAYAYAADARVKQSEKLLELLAATGGAH